MKRRIGIREIIFRALAGLLTAIAAVMLVWPLVGGPSRSGASLARLIGEIVFFAALGVYAVLGEGPAYKLLGITPPPGLDGDDKQRPPRLPESDDRSHLPESREREP